MDLTTFLTFIFCLYFVFRGVTSTTNIRQSIARAIPLNDKRLDKQPLRNYDVRSRSECLRLCMEVSGCKSLNFKSPSTCEILDTFLCENTASLAPSPDFMYFDVEFEDTMEDIGTNDWRVSCQNEGKCSPKCPCEWSSEFDVTSGYYVAGFTRETINSVTLEGCKTSCVEATGYLCKSADYDTSGSICYLSSVNKDDVPSAFFSQINFEYIHRICQ